MTELVDLRLHQQALAHEFYRNQIMQRIPDPYPSMLPVPPPPRHQLPMPPRYLPGVEAKLQNAELWKEFHHIGTEMIITKSGRRMFPSLRLSLSGLEDDVNYCVLIEMVPMGDCRFKFSGSQWVPAGGAEPQSPHRMYLHQDSPALGSHWTAQPVLFNKVKLTNNTLDNNGHIVLTSMHKYQPRIHVIRTSDPSQIPWSPQSAFSFNETEFVAVTAYQNDRITKLKIDNNPFAKGFRETGQSRCKRKSVPTPTLKATGSQHDDNHDNHDAKRMRSDSSACSVSSLDDSGLSISESSSGTSSPEVSEDVHLKDERLRDAHHPHFLQHYNQLMNPWMDMAFSYLTRAPYSYYPSIPLDLIPSHNFPPQSYHHQPQHQQQHHVMYPKQSPSPCFEFTQPKHSTEDAKPPPKKSSFTISAILGNDR